jgi:hypothetical protein
MISAAPPMPRPRTTEDNITGEANERRTKRSEAQHFAAISWLFTEPKHQEPEQTEHFTRAATEANKPYKVLGRAPQKAFETRPQLARTHLFMYPSRMYFMKYMNH